MLTKISNDLIYHYLHKCDINEYFKSKTIKHLYDSLNRQYVNSRISMTQDYKKNILHLFLSLKVSEIKYQFAKKFILINGKHDQNII